MPRSSGVYTLPPGLSSLASGTLQRAMVDALWKDIEAALNDTTGTVAPSSGAHARGERVYHSEPSAGGKIGWVCTAAGTPGTWKAWGVIDA